MQRASGGGWRWRTTRVGAAATLLMVVVGTSPARSQEVGATCAGHPVTIHFDDPGVGSTINGTNGPDVIQGGPQREVINARAGEDVVCGGGGDDDFDGGAGRDELLGQSGSDFFTGPELGQDVITGGAGDLDLADYSQLAAGVEVDLSTGLVRAVGAGVSGGILGFERVWGTGRDDILVGGPRADSISGFGGNDRIDGRGGPDSLRGGNGTDRVTHEGATAPVQIRVEGVTATIGDVEDLVSGFEVYVGTRFADRMIGADGPDHFIGGGGDDVLKGYAGDDIYEGGAGDDTIFPGTGDDFVDGGANDPVTSSGEHGDLVSYHGEEVNRPDGRRQFDAYLYTSQIGSPPGSVGVGEDEFAGVESLRGPKRGLSIIQGNDGPNVLIGGEGQSYLEGRGGNDLIYGLGGNDYLFGDYAAGANPTNFGDDYIDGGAPAGPTDNDRVHGDGGDDTCTGANPAGDNMDTCETIF